MFGFFKKKKKSPRPRRMFTSYDLDFFRSVVKKLPAKYSFLLEQITPKLWTAEEPDSEDNDLHFLVFNNDIRDPFENENIPSVYRLRNIRVRNKVDGAIYLLELMFYNGVINRYKMRAPIEDLDMATIDCSRVQADTFRNNDREELNKILQGIDQELLASLNIADTYEIEIEEGNFYVIKYLEDGNFLAITKRGEVYLLVHDPYVVKKLFDTKEEFFDAIKSNSFDAQKALDEVIS